MDPTRHSKKDLRDTRTGRETLDRQIAERRRDKAFTSRLRSILREDREVLERLAK